MGTEQQQQPDETDVLWEQRRSFLCFGWHQPFFNPRWIDNHGQSVVQSDARPKTRAYRKALKGKEGGDDGWQWNIVIDEHTDDLGWTYGGCGFAELFQHRMSLRSRPGVVDVVKRRKWVHQSKVPELRKNATRGSFKAMDPKQIHDKRLAARKDLKEAKAAIWDMIDELDSSIHIKDLYMSLLDPVAISRVGNKHIKEMEALKEKVLAKPRVMLLPEEQWAPPLLQDPALGLHVTPHAAAAAAAAAHGAEGERNPLEELAHGLVEGTQELIDLAQRAGSEVGRTAATLVHKLLSDNAVARRVRKRGHLAAGADRLRTSMSQPITEQQAGLSTAGSLPTPSAGNSQFNSPAPAVAASSVASVNSPETPRLMQASQASGMASPVSPPPAFEGGATPPRPEAQPSPPCLIPSASEGKGKQHAGGTPAKKAVVESHATASEQEEATTSAKPPAAKGSQAAGLPQVPSAAPQRSRHFATQASMPPRSFRASPTMQRWHHGPLALGLGGMFRRPAPTVAAPDMALSLPELRCAYGHALGVYGDLEVYVNGVPAQTFTGAVTKYTGVPAEDVLMAVWKSQVFKPGHYVAIDRAMNKIVVAIRGTFESADAISDLVARPVAHTFSPYFTGMVHDGMIKAALYVVESVWPSLNQALLLAPDTPILATGHSMGGGVAGLVAVMLRCHQQLPADVRNQVRAVCLAPAAVMDLQLTTMCKSFVASVIWDCDVVPRIDIHSFAAFVQEVAKASPLNHARKQIKRAWRTLTCSRVSTHHHKHGAGGNGVVPTAQASALAEAQQVAPAAQQEPGQGQPEQQQPPWQASAGQQPLQQESAQHRPTQQESAQQQPTQQESAQQQESLQQQPLQQESAQQQESASQQPTQQDSEHQQKLQQGLAQQQESAQLQEAALHEPVESQRTQGQGQQGSPQSKEGRPRESDLSAQLSAQPLSAGQDQQQGDGVEQQKQLGQQKQQMQQAQQGQTVQQGQQMQQMQQAQDGQQRQQMQQVQQGQQRQQMQKSQQGQTAQQGQQDAGQQQLECRQQPQVATELKNASNAAASMQPQTPPGPAVSAHSEAAAHHATHAVRGKLTLIELFPPGVLLWVIPDATHPFNLSNSPSSASGRQEAASAVPSPEEQVFEDHSVLPETSAGAPSFVGMLMSDLDNGKDEVSVPVPAAEAHHASGGGCACFTVGTSGEGSMQKPPPPKPRPTLQIRQVKPKVFSQLLLFKKALMDHLPTEYLEAMRTLVRQQQLVIEQRMFSEPPKREANTVFPERSLSPAQPWEHSRAPVISAPALRARLDPQMSGSARW